MVFSILIYKYYFIFLKWLIVLKFGLYLVFSDKLEKYKVLKVDEFG